MKNNTKPQRYNTTYQLKLPLEISTIIEVSDPVYTFCEVMDHIDLRKYLVTEENKTGRKRYDSEILLKVILFAFMERGYASDTDCFRPLVERFHNIYGEYPEYPVADAGYGSFNNYLYCEEQGMKKYIKFTMFKKECEDKKYSENPYRAVNFNINENGNLICPNNKEFHYLYSSSIKGNKYGRREEYYQCEDCTSCPHKEQCCKCTGNRIVRINKELTKMHQEVLANLNSTHGALLRMNRSIQAEGAYGTIKWNKAYIRARRGLKGMNFEIAVISCGFNLHKYHLKQALRQLAA